MASEVNKQEKEEKENNENEVCTDCNPASSSSSLPKAGSTPVKYLYTKIMIY